MFPLHDDNPTSKVPILTLFFISACIAAFLWQLSLGSNAQKYIYAYGAIPAVLLGGKSLPPDISLIPVWATAFTSMFLHGGWMHLLGNMLYLWIFGNNVEDAMGHKRFLVFYFLCGLIAMFSHAYMDTQSDIPMIGASGAISGILGAYLMLYPNARVLVAIPLGFIIHTTRLSAAWVLGFWFVFQLINSALSSGNGPGVAWGAHIGGFLAGLILVVFFKRKGVTLFAPARRR